MPSSFLQEHCAKLTSKILTDKHSGVTPVMTLRTLATLTLTLGSCFEHDRVPVSAAVVDPRVDVGPGVASHLLPLDLQQNVLQHDSRLTDRNLILHGRLI